LEQRERLYLYLLIKIKIMIGIQIFATTTPTYFAVVKEDETPKIVEGFFNVQGTSGGVSSTSTALPNRFTMVSTNKQFIVDYITSVGAVYGDGVEEPA
jgi:hypothetical protein